MENVEYILESSLDLQSDSWVEVDRAVVEDGGEVTLSDPSPPAASKFHRQITIVICYVPDENAAESFLIQRDSPMLNLGETLK